jgi:hypothetical protein
MAKVPAKSDNKSNLPTTESFESMAGAGMENVTGADLLIPRLGILQALSPQLNKKKPEFIEGASIGDIADLGTGELFDGAVQFLPVYFKKVYIEWAPRDSGKGLVAIHESDECLQRATQNDKGQWFTEEGNLISETHQFFGLNLSTPDRRKGFVSFTSTQIKKSRKWNTLASSIKLKRKDGSEYTPPLFFSTYSLGTAEESNSSGEWSGWTVARGAKLEDLEGWEFIFQDAKEFYEMLVKGEAAADMSDDEPTQSSGGDNQKM